MQPALFTTHFGLVSDFLSECFTRLRLKNRMSAVHGRVYFGGALSGRDINGVNKTVSGLLKLLYPDPEASVPDEDLEWAVRLALEVRRRVKEQQKRIGAAQFWNTHFSYTLGAEGIEKFVAELAVEKNAKTLLMPVSCRRQLNDLSDEMATKLDIEFYQDARDALLKSLAD